MRLFLLALLGSVHCGFHEMSELARYRAEQARKEKEAAKETAEELARTQKELKEAQARNRALNRDLERERENMAQQVKTESIQPAQNPFAILEEQREREAAIRRNELERLERIREQDIEAGEFLTSLGEGGPVLLSDHPWMTADEVKLLESEVVSDCLLEKLVLGETGDGSFDKEDCLARNRKRTAAEHKVSLSQLSDLMRQRKAADEAERIRVETEKREKKAEEDRLKQERLKKIHEEAARKDIEKRIKDHSDIVVGSKDPIIFARKFFNEKAWRSINDEFGKELYESKLVDGRSDQVGYVTRGELGGYYTLSCFDRVGHEYLNLAFTFNVFAALFGPGVSKAERESHMLQWCGLEQVRVPTEPEQVGGCEIFSSPGNRVSLEKCKIRDETVMKFQKRGWNQECKPFQLVVRDNRPGLVKELSQLPAVLHAPCLEGIKESIVSSDRVKYEAGECFFKSGGRKYARISVSEDGLWFCKLLDDFVQSNEKLRSMVLGSSTAWAFSSSIVPMPAEDISDLSGDIPAPGPTSLPAPDVTTGCVTGATFVVCPNKVEFRENFGRGETCENSVVVPMRVNEVEALARELKNLVQGLSVPCGKNNDFVNELKGWGHVENAVWAEWLENFPIASPTGESNKRIEGQYVCHGIEGSENSYSTVDSYVRDDRSVVSEKNRAEADKAADNHCAWVYVLKHWVSLIQHRAGLSYEDPTTWGQ